MNKEAKEALNITKATEKYTGIDLSIIKQALQRLDKYEQILSSGRLTDRNYKNTTLDLDSCKPYLRLGQLEDIYEEGNHNESKTIGDLTLNEIIKIREQCRNYKTCNECKTKNSGKLCYIACKLQTVISKDELDQEIEVEEK